MQEGAGVVVVHWTFVGLALTVSQPGALLFVQSCSLSLSPPHSLSVSAIAAFSLCMSVCS